MWTANITKIEAGFHQSSVDFTITDGERTFEFQEKIDGAPTETEIKHRIAYRINQAIDIDALAITTGVIDVSDRLKDVEPVENEDVIKPVPKA